MEKKKRVLCSVHKLLFLECDVSELCPCSHTHNETPAFLQPDMFPSSGKKAEGQYLILADSWSYFQSLDCDLSENVSFFL